MARSAFCSWVRPPRIRCRNRSRSKRCTSAADIRSRTRPRPVHDASLLMKLTRSALLILALWVALLAGLTWFVQRQLQVGADLRLFLPSPTTPEQQLLLEEI